jgi:predicted small lipoprotein YifL
MKKIFACCLTAVMLLSLAACGQDVPENDEASSNSSQQVGKPSMSGNPKNEGGPDIAPEDEPDSKSSQQTAEQGQISLSEGDDKADTHNGLDTADWKVEIDKGPYMENYKDIPERPNAEPNWNDTQSSTQKGAPENAVGTPDIAPEDDLDAGGNQQVAQQFLVDLPSNDGSGLEDTADTASYAGAAAEEKIP